MPIYNPKTFLLIASLLTGLMGCVLLLMPATSRRIPGIQYWAAGSLMAAMAGVLILLRDIAPVWLTFTVENTAVMLAFSFFMLGSAKHWGQTCHLKPWLALFVVAWCVQLYCTYGLDSLRGRNISVAGFVFATGLMHTQVFVREIHRRHVQHESRALGMYFTGFWVAFSTLIFGVRWLHAVALPQTGQGMLDTTLLQMLYISSYVFGIVMMNIGFQLLAAESIRGEFEKLAMTDALTGVHSRRAVVSAAHACFQRSQRHARSFALMMLDLDHFKSLNDQFGHQIGDQVLQAFCRRIETSLRREDVLGRLGGEEFVVLMPDKNAEQATQIANSLVNIQAAADAQLPSTTVSIGVSEWRPGDASLEDLLARADRALYAAKASGRNCAIMA